jgi:hypothetical protein
MLDIVKNSQNHNGNGSDAINGRGVLRRKMAPALRANLAADVAMGLTQFTPSLKQTAAALGVSPYSVRQVLKARAKKQAAWETEKVRHQEALTIVNAWDAATAQGRAEAVRLISAGEIWDVLASVVG